MMIIMMIMIIIVLVIRTGGKMYRQVYTYMYTYGGVCVCNSMRMCMYRQEVTCNGCANGLSQNGHS